MVRLVGRPLPIRARTTATTYPNQICKELGGVAGIGKPPSLAFLTLIEVSVLIDVDALRIQE